MNCEKLIHENIVFLQQGADLLNSIDDRIYNKTDSTCYASGIGKHIRHNLDHFDNFLTGLPKSAIDYDARLRDKNTENSRGVAASRIKKIISRLEKLTAADPSLKLRVDMNREGDRMNWTESTLARELQFLISHTVHHYAIIAMILKIQGVDLQISGFGVAPSTLKYERGTPSAEAA